MKRGIFLVAVIATLLCLSRALTFTADAGRDSCFYDDLKTGDAVTFMYQVTSGGQLDIDLTTASSSETTWLHERMTYHPPHLAQPTTGPIQVNAPGGTNILRRQKETEGRYTFNAHVDGPFSICFGNTMSTFTDKDIVFEWDVSRVGSQMDKLAKEEQLTPLGNQIIELAASFSNFQAEQKYLKMREMRLRNTNEATTSSVVMWTLIECGALVLASFFQVYNLKRFFEDRRTL